MNFITNYLRGLNIFRLIKSALFAFLVSAIIYMYQQAYGEVGHKTPGIIMNTLLLLSPFSYYVMFDIKSGANTFTRTRVYYITRDTLAFYGLFKIVGIVIWGTVFLFLSPIFTYIHFKDVSKYGKYRSQNK
ncbi:hypothetical protein ETI06_07085 [Macrococcoides goetzii]|nr:hypothetical protein [Macrococcus goetzii]TDM49302.1 hypothetical protein ETI06_07085 [Macrococcus goetzii]